MDIGRSISFIFEDRSWIVKILILGVFFLIPVIGWLLIGGYLLRLLANVINGEPNPLPEWNNWGGDIAGGLKAFVVALIWGIPSWILQAIASAADSAIFSLIGWLIGILFSAIVLSALGDLALSGNLADAFNRKPFDRVVQNLNFWAIVIVMDFVFSILALVGLIGFVIGVIFTLAIAVTAQMHLAGQAYRLSEGRGSVVTRRF
jgi:hypothetical protein